jgi:hypothetical protein
MLMPSHRKPQQTQDQMLAELMKIAKHTSGEA